MLRIAWGSGAFGWTLALAMLVLPAGTQARNYKQLYGFQGGKDGAHPQYNLLMRGSELYGSTLYGGAAGDGTMFRLASDGTGITTLYSFRGIGAGDGAYPGGPPLMDKSGNLYDVTFEGGTGSCFGSAGCGTVFKLAPNGAETVLHAFTGGTDGAAPDESVTMDKTGNLYGTTEVGGSGACSYMGYPAGCGTVFKLAPDGTESVLYAFHGGSDGAAPNGNLIADKSGNFYGTTTLGGGTACQGFGCGTIFRLAPDGTEKVLYSFCTQAGCSDGADPIFTSLYMDRHANLFGTTEFGGSGTGCGSGKGCGTVYEFAADGTESVLYSFCSLAHCSDGNYPDSNVIVDRKGNLYSTTAGGGARNVGTVFKVSRDGAETLLHSFEAGRDGASPNAGVIADGRGTLYGLTYYGGSGKGCGSQKCGTVYGIKE